MADFRLNEPQLPVASDSCPDMLHPVDACMACQFGRQVYGNGIEFVWTRRRPKEVPFANTCGVTKQTYRERSLCSR